MISEKRRAAPFKATRKHHSSEAAEDYTELIADLIQRNGEARTGQIAKHLGISHVTALRTLRRLKEQGYILGEQHAPITLTAKGTKLARDAKIKHELLVQLFVHLGVPSAVAEVDVEGAEHHISAVTLSCIRRFIEQNVKK